MIRHTSLRVIGLAACALTLGHSALLNAAEPTAFLESATIVGASDTLVLSRVPVRSSTGVILYKDVSMEFAVENSGNLILDLGSVTITNSPALKTGTFKPGNYRGYVARYGAQNDFTVGSPGVGPGGRISGSIQRINTYYTYDVFNASWTSGPITGHPDAAKLKAAGITSTAYNWGVMGTAGSYTEQGGWKPGDIVGAVQNGNQLMLVNFGTDNKSDASLTFDLCPSANPC